VSTSATALELADALANIAARAAHLDRTPHFPTQNMDELRATGMLGLVADRSRTSLCAEVSLVRAVAWSDASTARILDGHLNGVERLALSAPAELREAELEGVARGALLLGVWGADPAPGEGPPAQLVRNGSGVLVLEGVKTFCSGAGGVQRALVVVREASGAQPPATGGVVRRRLAYVDATEGVGIDREWYRASGLRASESHRVEFHGTPVLALLGGENELAREPWFSRDAVRTSATWAGIADGIFDAAVAELADRKLDELQLRALGYMRVARATIDRWLEYAGKRLDEDAVQDPGGVAIECRAAITEAARTIAAEAVRACGSRALIAGAALDRGRRDLDLFLLQHRLDPHLARLGRSTLEQWGARL
jgi:hypothetical protein